MNKAKIQTAEKLFFEKYPGGFEHPEMLAISKKHKMEKFIAQAQEMFAPENFKDTDASDGLMLENMIKMLTRSSMVSVFEKPKFRDFARSLSDLDKRSMVTGLKEFLHGDEETGFNLMLEVLTTGKLAKWSVITVWGAYYQPDFHVFCKPTTVKNVIATFDLQDLLYKPRPSYDFYTRYRDEINRMKKLVDPGFTANNAGFCGFLMMSVNMLEMYEE